MSEPVESLGKGRSLSNNDPQLDERERDLLSFHHSEEKDPQAFRMRGPSEERTLQAQPSQELSPQAERPNNRGDLAPQRVDTVQQTATSVHASQPRFNTSCSEEIIGHEYRPTLLPLHDLRRLDGDTWESTGIDPQFDVVGPWPKGWTKIISEIEAEEGVTGGPRLYVDSGDGYSEEETYDLGAINQEQVNYIPLGPHVIRLRLDPFWSKGEFRATKLIFQRVSGREEAKGARENRNTLSKEDLAGIYLHGMGIEIGALNSPLKVPADAKVRYVDRKIPAELEKFYVVGLKDIKAPDVIMDGERLAAVRDESQNFVIANNFIEHCEDPIGAIESFLRVLKRHGILFLALPDKRFTFDFCRPVTTFEHLLRDYREGGEWSRFGHHEEAHRLILGITNEKQIRRNIEEMGDTHYHVWTQIEMLEMVVRLRRELAFDCEVEAFFRHPPFEAILVIRKGAAKMSEQDELSWLKVERENYQKRYPDFEF